MVVDLRLRPGYRSKRTATSPVISRLRGRDEKGRLIRDADFVSEAEELPGSYWSNCRNGHREAFNYELDLMSFSRRKRSTDCFDNDQGVKCMLNLDQPT